MDIHELKKDQIFTDYLEEKAIKRNTALSYSTHMVRYCNSTDMTPTELLNEACDEENNRIPMWERKIKQHLKKYANHLKDKDYTKRHQEGAMVAIRNFYSWHDIELPKARPTRATKTHETIEDIPTKEEIKEALGYCNPKYKAIILLMLSSGIASVDIRNLRVQDFFDSLSEYFKTPLKLPLDIDQINKRLINKLVIPTFKFTRTKTTTPVITFASPEAVNAILYFLDKYPPESTDNYLFPNSKTNKEKHILENTFTAYFRRINEKCEFGKVNRTVKFHSHAMRKYFATVLQSNDIKHWSTEAMLGHADKSRTTSAYFKPDPIHLKNDYIRVVKYLSIEDIDVKTMESPEFTEIQKKLKKQDETIAKLEAYIEAKETLDNIDLSKKS